MFSLDFCIFMTFEWWRQKIWVPNLGWIPPSVTKWSSGGASLSNILFHPSNTSAKNTFSIYKYFLPFSPLFFFTSTQSICSFSKYIPFSVFLLACKKYIFFLQIFSLFSCPVFFCSAKYIVYISKYFHLSLLCFAWLPPKLWFPSPNIFSFLSSVFLSSSCHPEK